MKHRWLLVGIIFGALIFGSACGMVNTLLGGRSAGTVTDLWDDVPRMEGMTKAELEMPLAARLALQAVTQGKMNFISFTTDATPQAVLDFYTVERMGEQGWSNDNSTGCFGDAEDAQAGAICVYTKNTDGKDEVLAVVAAKDEGTGKTAIFFARIDTSAMATEESGG
jgi:hypothetical protein